MPEEFNQRFIIIESDVDGLKRDNLLIKERINLIDDAEVRKEVEKKLILIPGSVIKSSILDGYITVCKMYHQGDLKKLCFEGFKLLETLLSVMKLSLIDYEELKKPTELSQNPIPVYQRLFRTNTSNDGVNFRNRLIQQKIINNSHKANLQLGPSDLYRLVAFRYMYHRRDVYGPEVKMMDQIKRLRNLEAHEFNSNKGDLEIDDVFFCLEKFYDLIIQRLPKIMNT